MSQLVNTIDLIEWSEIKQKNKLIEWLRENNISYRLSGVRWAEQNHRVGRGE